MAISSDELERCTEILNAKYTIVNERASRRCGMPEARAR
ncbi:hypothetical protein EDF38_2728 [Frigoribacterium sp. PhB160]|nr:hypothetical protein EDF38_2728 [Frigoribacterium sp. PhB160]